MRNTLPVNSCAAHGTPLPAGYSPGRRWVQPKSFLSSVTSRGFPCQRNLGRFNELVKAVPLKPGCRLQGVSFLAVALFLTLTGYDVWTLLGTLVVGGGLAGVGLLLTWRDVRELSTYARDGVLPLKGGTAEYEYECLECGALLLESDTVCPNCGASLLETSEGEET